MDLIGSLFLFIALALISYVFMGRLKNEQVVTTIDNSLAFNEEITRKKEIMHKVESFLGEAQFMEPIGKWRDEYVYKYVFNAGYLYQFEDTMSPINQRIGRDEDHLCFKQLCYKRVNNPVDFINTFAEKLNKPK